MSSEHRANRNTTTSCMENFLPLASATTADGIQLARRGIQVQWSGGKKQLQSG